MRTTLTIATLPAGPMLTQYGVQAPITLDSDSLGYPQNYGRSGWQDAHIPRTSDPIRFDYRRVSAWCSPTKQFESATWTEEQRILNYYRQRGI